MTMFFSQSASLCLFLLSHTQCFYSVFIYAFSHFIFALTNQECLIFFFNQVRFMSTSDLQMPVRKFFFIYISFLQKARLYQIKKKNYILVTIYIFNCQWLFKATIHFYYLSLNRKDASTVELFSLINYSRRKRCNEYLGLWKSTRLLTKCIICRKQFFYWNKHFRSKWHCQEMHLILF